MSEEQAKAALLELGRVPVPDLDRGRAWSCARRQDRLTEALRA